MESGMWFDIVVGIPLALLTVGAGIWFGRRLRGEDEYLQWKAKRDAERL